MSEVVIHAENLSKLYRIGSREPYKTLRDTLTDVIYSPFRYFHQNIKSCNPSTEPVSQNPKSDYIWAIKDVSFEIKRGDVVGIIGRNGAGKSTLLKILSRITEPTEGSARIHGRIGSLLEVGTGFNPELTGRENIYLNGAILGMKRAEINQRFDEIVAFAEVEKFIDTPVKHYSSGMHMRLAFAVAAHLELEILLVDEVLAVGDIRFQKKCMDKMSEVGKGGRTVLFVSHSISAIMRLCPRVILLNEGKIIEEGPASKVVGAYLQSGIGTSVMREWPSLKKSPGDDVVRLRAIHLRTEKGRLCESVDISQPVGIEITYDVLKSGIALIPACRISNQEGIILFQTNDWNPKGRQIGRYKGIIWIPGNLLAEGTFYVSVAIATIGSGVTTKRIFEKEAVAFQVAERMDKGAMRAMWGGDHPGVIRPSLPWETEGPMPFVNNQVFAE